MGVRIHAYAVDLPKFDRFLDTSLADLIRQYQRDGIDEGTKFNFTIGENPDHYETTPRGEVRAHTDDSFNRKSKMLCEEDLRANKPLQYSARELLSNEDIYQAYWLLEAFSNCKGVDFIKNLIGGHRRWWIGSVLQSAKPVLDANDFKEMEHLFAKILRGTNCGFNMSIEDGGLVTDGLPFVPEDDPDERFGRWSEQECSAAMLLLTKVMASSPKFSCPPGAAVFQWDDSEWEKWPRDNVLSLLRLRDLNYAKCNLLSFIG